MALSTCDPCCSPSQFARDKESFKAASLTILCNLLSAFTTNIDQQISLEILCDPGTGEPIALQVYYGSDGVITDTKAFHLDGTPYVGVITSLASCFDNLLSPDAGNIVVEHADGLYVPAFVNLGLFGDGSDGNVTVSVNTTLTRDMFYDNLTINTASKLSPDGYRIFVKSTLTVGAGSSIDRTGNNGANGAGAAAGLGGAGFSTFGRSLFGNRVGGNGGAGNNGVGTTGPSIGIFRGVAGGLTGGNGGNGGNGVNTHGNGGQTNAGDAAPVYFLTPHPFYGTYPVNGGIAGAGGGGGGGSGALPGGGGGGGAAGGGVILVFARHIVLTGDIKASGGNGGNGGNGTGGGGATGGGGGGASGSGGVIYCCYEDFTGVGNFIVTPGTPGNGGSGASGGTAGIVGGTGSSGNVIRFEMSSNSFV